MRTAATLLAALAFLSPTRPDESDWIQLTDGKSMDVWASKTDGWNWAETVGLSEKNPKLLAFTGSGPILVNGEKGRARDLITKQKFTDLEVHVEFLIAKGSNSGIKFHAVYEIQILDTFGKTKLSGDSMGGIYPRAELKPNYHHIDDGIAPKVNAAKPAGEWQTLDVTFLSPRLDADGKKVANAKVVKAVLNGQLVHENQELLTPTGNNWNKKEVGSGPFMLQGDHGPVAFRNVRIRELKK
ncbi:MAG: DUF1080 domain-containing protein [Gemmataceae bacterium]